MNSTKNTNSKTNKQINKFVDRGLAESQAWINSSTYYASHLLLKVLVDAALTRSSVEDVCSAIAEYPSPDTVMAMLAKTHCNYSRNELEAQIAHIYQNQVKHHIMFKRRISPLVILAIDLHDEEYYGNHLYDGKKRLTMFSPRKRRNALRFATLSIVSADNRWICG